MGVYIDREQAIKCLDGSVLITRQSEAEAVREYFEMVIKRLENLPTIDIVRCGECIHRVEDSDFQSGHICLKRRNNGGLYCEDDDYCSYAERRAE